MNRKMLFRTIIYDTQYGNDSNVLNFFSDSSQDDESVTVMNEDQIVKWLFTNSSFYDFFVEQLFENPKNIKAFFNLESPFTEKAKKPGDIDLILVDRNSPNQAIAFECKKIKALSSVSEYPKVNGVSKIKGGVTQVQFYKKLGFHQTYLMIILLDDGRHYDTPNIMFRNTDVEHLNNLYNIPRDLLKDDGIGVVFVKVEQTSGKHINLAGNISFCIDKEAGHYIQLDSMTEKISYILNNKDY
jgi:hypothetical protein